MKNKSLKTILALSFLISSPACIHADDWEVTTSDTKYVELYAEKTSSYSVKFPRKVDITSTSSNFTIQLKGDINGDDKISLTIPESAKLTENTEGQAKHGDIDLTVEASKKEFGFLDLQENYQTGGNGNCVVTITHTAIPAGNWSYNLPIAISVS